MILDGRYQILDQLSSGATGVIYLAQHLVLDRRCAIKILFDEYARAPNMIERFRREANAVSRVQHPNIVSVIDYGRTLSGTVYIVLELVEGRTLEAAILEQAPFTPQRTAHIARQICSALTAVHEPGFVHRDIKPANIMLSGPENSEVVKLIDFGLVGIADDAGDRLTKAGHLLGTPRYMAPEQCFDPAVTATADLYALGVVMFEMLSGRVPFDGETVTDVLKLHLSQEAPMLPSCGGLEVLVAQLLQKKPRDRPASSSEVVGAIDRLGLRGGERLSAIIRIEEPVELDARDAPPPVAIARLELASSRDPSNPVLIEPELPPEVRERWRSRPAVSEPSVT